MVARDHTPPVHLAGSWLCGDPTNGAVDWWKLVSIADNAAMTLAPGAAVAPTLRVRTRSAPPWPSDCTDTLTRPKASVAPVGLRVPVPVVSLITVTALPKTTWVPGVTLKKFIAVVPLVPLALTEPTAPATVEKLKRTSTAEPVLP